ncbi:MAG TPA: hypothetical protein PLH34_02400 [Bacillota bacterium]|nr:hypothetical protein [Bacillota bacterium]
MKERRIFDYYVISKSQGCENAPWSVIETLEAVEAVLSLDEVIGAENQRSN